MFSCWLPFCFLPISFCDFSYPSWSENMFGSLLIFEARSPISWAGLELTSQRWPWTLILLLLLPKCWIARTPHKVYEALGVKPRASCLLRTHSTEPYPNPNSHFWNVYYYIQLFVCILCMCMHIYVSQHMSLSLGNMFHCLPSVGIKSTCCHTWLLSYVLEIEPRSSCLCGRHFTNQAISPTPKL